MYNVNKSPFKFLDPYEKKDIQHFFGREKETDLLYDRVSKNRIVLVYGQSGTGKTSIIQCGLANAFDPTDWLPYFIRRDDNINDAVLKALQRENIPPNEHETELIRERLFDESNTNDSFSDYDKKYLSIFCYKLEKITQKYLRPVYLIFDQFEELFILGTDDERTLFLKTLKTLVNHDEVIDCHIIIVMREEYFAWMEMFEAEIPEIVDCRLRIEPMRRKEMKEMITKTFAHFNIMLREPKGDVEQILKTLTGNEEKREVALTYLQVHMDQLWKKDFERTYPNGYTGNEKYPPLEFTTDEIKAYGEKKEEILQNFLLNKKNEVLAHVRKEFKDKTIADDLVTRILDSFVNDRGTKIPNAFKLEDGIYKFKDYTPDKFLSEQEPHILTSAINMLVTQQILRSDGKRLELGHDILARLIDRQRDGIQRRQINIRLMIANYVQGNERIPYETVKNWEKDVEQMKLPVEHRKFFEESKEHGYREAVQKDIKNALEKREVEYQIRAGKNKNMLKGVFLGVGLVVLVMAVLSGCEYWKRKRANDSVYATSTIRQIDTIRNKLDALHYAKYIADFKSYDQSTFTDIKDRTVQIATHPSFATIFARQHWLLKSSQSLTPGIDVDISPDGHYLVIKNEVLQSSRAGSTYMLYAGNKERPDTVFENIHYAYFLNGLPLLLVAQSSEQRIGFETYPDKIGIYDCSKRAMLTHIDIGMRKNYPCFLYSRDYLVGDNNREWDSYKVRITSAGNLVIPYFSLIETKTSREAVGFVEIRNLYDSVLTQKQSGFSVSLSPGRDRILYVYKKNNRYQFEMCTQNGDSTWLVENAGFVDFTKAGNIIYHKRTELVLMQYDRSMLRRVEVPRPVKSILTGNDDLFAIIEYRDDNTCALVNMQSGRVINMDAKLVGFNFDKRQFIINVESSTAKQSSFVLKGFDGQTIKEVKYESGIENFSFNNARQTLLVKTNKQPQTNMQILYLLNDSMNTKGSFFLTPNDAYGFSNNGASFYFVRDNDLSVYDNKPYLDISSYESIYSWLEKDKEKNGALKPQEFRKKYDIPKFPSQTIF